MTPVFQLFQYNKKNSHCQNRVSKKVNVGLDIYCFFNIMIIVLSIFYIVDGRIYRFGMRMMF